MKNVTVSMIIVLLITIGVWMFSVRAVEDACSEAQRLCGEAERLYECGAADRATEKMEQLMTCWKRHEAVLTAVLSHSSIGDVTRLVIEARSALLGGNRQEFAEDMMLLRERLENLRAQERLSLANILAIC